MTWTEFVTRFEDIAQERKAPVILRLNPTFEKLPLPIQRFDDPFFPFSKAIIQATEDLVCGYMFDLAAYLAMGGAGGIALERSIRYVGRDHITILHGPFANADYGAATDVTGFGVDALTVTQIEWIQPYLEQPPFAAFAMAEENTPMPDAGGLCSLESRWIRWRGGDTMTHATITDDTVLYAGRLENFADDVRRAVEEMQG